VIRPSIDWQTKTIFVVDDEARYVTALRVYLEHALGAEVVGFVDPFDAFSAALLQRPDLVYTDMQMPACTGAQLAVALREALGEDCPALVLVTGDDVQPHVADLFDATHLKPAPPGDLAWTATHLVGGRASGTRRRG
jgi:DNA-binding NarL/FixJ family response regulator